LETTSQPPSDPLLQIVHEDAELLVLHKPADLVCHPTKNGPWSSLIGRVRLHLGPSVQPQMIHRLDRETSGLVVVAKQDDAARALRRLWEARAVEKEYDALVHGHVSEDEGAIEAPLGRDETSRVAIKDCVRADGAPACTRFRVIRRFERDGETFSRLSVLPLTGRKHQIRIHLAHAGHPVVGDKLYGPDEQIYLALVERRLTDEHRRRLRLPCHALHAGRLTFCWRDQSRTFASPPEPWFRAFADGA
jgi:23S rRNA pseudouridine1911/1915/1917 synthase